MATMAWVRRGALVTAVVLAFAEAGIALRNAGYPSAAVGGAIALLIGVALASLTVAGRRLGSARWDSLAALLLFAYAAGMFAFARTFSLLGHSP